MQHLIWIQNNVSTRKGHVIMETRYHYITTFYTHNKDTKRLKCQKMFNLPNLKLTMYLFIFQNHTGSRLMERQQFVSK
jgi:hypothetical protein